MLFDRTMGILGQALDLYTQRHTVIASNLANEETPGYRAQEVNFEEALRKAIAGGTPAGLRLTHPRHLGGPTATSFPSLQVSATPIATPDLPLDQNSVNQEQELMKLQQNTLQYQTVSAVLSQRLRQVLAAIQGVK